MALDNVELTEQLFEAIDTIVKERLRNLPYDKTLVATITDVANAPYGKYEVTTDNNIKITAYSERTDLCLKDQVYVKVPQNDYSQLKIITEKYVPDTQENELPAIISVKLREELDSIWAELKKQQSSISALQNGSSGGNGGGSSGGSGGGSSGGSNQSTCTECGTSCVTTCRSDCGGQAKGSNMCTNGDCLGTCHAGCSKGCYGNCTDACKNGCGSQCNGKCVGSCTNQCSEKCGGYVSVVTLMAYQQQTQTTAVQKPGSQKGPNYLIIK